MCSRQKQKVVLRLKPSVVFSPARAGGVVGPFFVLRREMTVGRCTVGLIMRRLGPAGLLGWPRYRRFPTTQPLGIS